jgi:predicted Zn-dependent protease
MALAIVLNNQHRYSEAAEILRDILKDNNDASTWYLLGQAEENSGNIAGAREAYIRAVTLEPDFIQAKQRLQHLK